MGNVPSKHSLVKFGRCVGSCGSADDVGLVSGKGDVGSALVIRTLTVSSTVPKTGRKMAGLDLHCQIW